MAAVESGLPKVQQEPSEALRIVVDNIGVGNFPKDEPRLSSFKCAVTIENKLEQPRQDDVEHSLEKLSIYRIPQYLKDGEEKAYLPQIVSIGPYHHGKEHLCRMDEHKRRCLRHILKRCNHEMGLYLDSMKEVEEKTRACYEGTISMSSNEFVQMMVLDGCFVIELFRGVAEGFKELGYPRNDPVFSMRGSMHTIQRDMIMLENQIPLFILDQLLGLQLGDPNQKGLVAKLALDFFHGLNPSNKPFFHLTVERLEFVHCLELFRWSILPSGQKSMRWSDRQQEIPCMTELWKAGIEFSRSAGDSFMDIRFDNGTLKIPQLLIHDGTRSLFLNLIAFEQCHSNCSNDITSYVVFMGDLINSPEDVRYLHDHKIIKHYLGSNAEVTALFNRLCHGVVLDINESYLVNLSEAVYEFYNHRRGSGGASLMQKFNAWRARLKHKCIDWASILKQNYFSNPWSIISLVAACVLLVLTFIQTFYAVYGYYRPRF